MRARKICVQKPISEPTNQDAGIEYKDESASIARTFESPDIAMETFAQPNNKKVNLTDEKEEDMIGWLTEHPEVCNKKMNKYKDTKNPKLFSRRKRLENLICLVLVSISWKIVYLDKAKPFDFHLFSFQNCQLIGKIVILPYIQNDIQSDITWILSDIHV